MTQDINLKNAEQVENTSGQGAKAIVPKEIQGWSWGAFCFTWIWGICNKVYITLILLIFSVIGVGTSLSRSFATNKLIPVSILIPALIIAIFFGLKGNKWAWQQKRWKSIKHFKKVQGIWSIAGQTVFYITLFFSIISLTLLLAYSINTVESQTTAQMIAPSPAAISIVKQAQSDKQIQKFFGTPIKFQNALKGGNTSKYASAIVKVKGPKNKGLLMVNGCSANGNWFVNRIYIRTANGNNLIFSPKRIAPCKENPYYLKLEKHLGYIIKT